MAQFDRTKKLTDYAYSPTEPASEDAIRLQVDGSIQEVADIIYSTDAGKGASQVGHTLGGAYGTDVNQALQIIIATGAGGGIPDNTVTDPKLSDAAGQIKDRVTTLDGAVVKKTGAQSIDDVKTFTSSPIVPTPTTNMQASTKKYVDDQDAFNLLKSGGAMTGILALQKPSTEFAQSTSKLYRNLKDFIETGQNTGTIIITLPDTLAEGQFSMKISGWDYNSNANDKSAWELLIGGYMLSSAWGAVSAVVTGNSQFLKVRMGKNASNKPVILIGELTTSWYSPIIQIKEFMTANASYATDAITIARITSESGITVSGTPVLQGAEPPVTTITSGFGGTNTGTMTLRKNTENLVTINATINSGATPATLYTLPVGFRPKEATGCLVNGTVGGGAQIYQMNISTGGVMTFVGMGADAPFTINMSFYAA